MGDFERAVDAIVTGDATTLAALLRDRAQLVHERSSRPHHATLLHYISANGVEDERQKTPPNAVEIARMLLDTGAEVDAVCDAYGGNSTTLDLLVSSVHPARAGLQVALAELLLDYGAAVNGLAGDGSPLINAISFHYPDTAEALVRRGARVDTLAKAAAMGREDLVQRFIESGDLSTQALLWAAAFGRTAIVDLLAQNGVDLAAKDNQGMTALHWAAFRGHDDVIDLLIARGAPLDVENNYGGTVLGCTIWASENSGLDVGYDAVIARLRASGAR
jgi:hypothetical protein